MAAETISMTKLKQIFLLKRQGESLRNIARITHTSKNTVKKYLRTAQEWNLAVETLAGKADHELEALFAEPAIESKDRHLDLLSFFPYMDKELCRVGVNRWLLWGEYKARFPDGYAYTQFCYHYRQWREVKAATGHFDRLPGDKTSLDFTGKKMQVVARDTGEIRQVDVLVVVLDYSGLTYVEALNSQKKEDLVAGAVRALSYFGGATRAIVPDNMKAAVTRADKYEADLNESFADFACHYGMAVVPARPRAPQDKPVVESMVGIIYTRIFAPLRNRTFFSLAELNAAMWELLEKHNHQPLQKESQSRWEKFRREEAAHLLPLPPAPYRIKHYKKARVMKNGHIQLEKHYYSVPYRYIGKDVKAVYTSEEVHVFLEADRIALHKRGIKPFGYTTQAEHLSSAHRFVSEWSAERFINWAGRISPEVKTYIETILSQKTYPEQAYRSCLGILSLEKKVGKDRLVGAIRRAQHYRIYHYKAIRKIIEGGLDILFEAETQENRQTRLPLHGNIRGKDDYQ